MALAIIKFDHFDGNQAVFRFEIGQNRYYAVAVGQEAERPYRGIEILTDYSYKSPLMGPLKESALGRGEVKIPRQYFDRKHRAVQLISYGSRALNGFAVSSPIMLQAILNNREEAGELPILTFAKENIMETSHQKTVSIPFRFKEQATGMSETMFLNALVGMLPSILPQAGKLLGGLLGGSQRSGNTAGGVTNETANTGTNSLLSVLQNPQNMQQIGSLIKQLLSATSAQSQATSLQGTSEKYSEAKIAPALLAALPALMPLLQKVLNPQTIKAVLDSPTKPIGMIVDGIKDFAKIGLEADKQEMQHLERLNPGVNDPALDKLLAGLSLSLSRDIKYKRVPQVRLNFSNVSTYQIYGQTKIPYVSGHRLAFPLVINTPKVIRRGTLTLRVKDPVTGKLHIERHYQVEQVETGSLLTVPGLEDYDVKDLLPDREYQISCTLVWKNKSGQYRGTSVTQMISLVSSYSFDRVEESTEIFPLNDVSTFREFWHKVWEGQFTREKKRFTYDCKYYYRLNKEQTVNSRIETKTRVVEQERKHDYGQLKSGMELSPDEINRLLPRLNQNTNSLTDEQMQPLRSKDFISRFNQAARYQAKFRGRAGQRAALWVYPEFKLQKVILKQVQSVNEHGHVLEFVEHEVVFPIPVTIHFIGAKTS